MDTDDKKGISDHGFPTTSRTISQAEKYRNEPSLQRGGVVCYPVRLRRQRAFPEGERRKENLFLPEVPDGNLGLIFPERQHEPGRKKISAPKAAKNRQACSPLHRIFLSLTRPKINKGCECHFT